MNPILTLLLLAVAGVILILVWRYGLSARAKRVLLGLVAEAEACFGAGTGEIKLSSVFGKLYAMMPEAFRLLFSERTVRAWIEDALTTLRGLLADKAEEEEDVDESDRTN